MSARALGTTSAIVGADPAPLKDRMVRSTVWAGTGLLAAQLLRLVGDAVMAWLLVPEAFGVVALIWSITTLVDTITEVGVNPSIIQSPRGDDKEFLDTAWTVQVIRGVGQWLLLVIAAWPLARIYRLPGFSYLFLAASLGLVISGFDCMAVIQQSRHFRLGKPILLFVVQRLVAILVMVAWALVSPTAWALVVGNLVGLLTHAVLSHFIVRGGRNRFRWEPGAWRELSRFGRWVFVATVLVAIAESLDKLLLGKLVPVAIVGVFHIASGYPGLIRRACMNLVTFILFPAFAELNRQEPERLQSKALEIRSHFLLLCMVPTLALGFYAPIYFETFFSAGYRDAGWMSQLLLVGMWVAILRMTAGRILLALGDSRSLAVSGGWQLACTIAGSVGGFAAAGVPGFILGLSVGPLVSHIYMQRRLAGHGFEITGQDLRYSAALLGLALLGEFSLGAGPRSAGRGLGPAVSLVFPTAILVAVGVLAARRVLGRIRSRGVREGEMRRTGE